MSLSLGTWMDPNSAGTVTYGYDAANRLTSVTDWDSNVIGYSYDDANRMTAKTLPTGTGIVSSYTYDDADRLTGISHVKGGTATLASVAYTLDDVGNRTQRVDQQGTHTYAYDDLYRLVEVTYPGPSTTEYTFDAFGNRLSMTDGSGTTDYSYDDADRLVEVDPPAASPETWTWDDNGNLTDRGADEFAWDEADRMVSAIVDSNTTTFAYRGDGLRHSRTTGAGTTTFTWDVNAGLPVVLHDGSYFVYGGGLEAMEQGGAWYYYLEDGLGSTMAVADDTGAVQNSYTYDVYGTPTVTGSLANEYDFAGQATDASTGLQYLRARYMDPETGVFLSREPLAVAVGWLGNPTSYSNSSPGNLSDPTGLAALPPDACTFVDDPSVPKTGCPHTGMPAGCGTWRTPSCNNDPLEVVKDLCYVLELCEAQQWHILLNEYGQIVSLSVDGRSLDSILRNDKLFRNWMRHSKDVKNPYDAVNSQKIWDELTRRGLKPRCDKTTVRPGSVWKDDHINVQHGGSNVHIPVAKGFCSTVK